MENYKWTVVAKTMLGKIASVHHYYAKRDALMEVASLAGYGYIVTMTKWTVWYGCREVVE